MVDTRQERIDLSLGRVWPDLTAVVLELIYVTTERAIKLRYAV